MSNGWHLCNIHMIQSFYLCQNTTVSMMEYFLGNHKCTDIHYKEPITAILLTHWSRVTHICVSKLTSIGSDNGLSPVRRQAIIWTNAGILLIRTLGTNFSEILCEIHTFSFKKMHFKMSSEKWRPFCLGLNVLTHHGLVMPHGASWVIIGLGHHGSSPVPHQVISWTNFDLLPWWHKSRLTMTQVMACCLIAPSHYLNQCWPIISKVQWHSSGCNAILQEIPQPPVTEISLKITYLKFCSNLPGSNELTKAS